MATLVAMSGPVMGGRYELAGALVVGRSPGCDLVLEDGRVSRRHARFDCVAGQCFVEDLGSRNGTLLNGTPVAGRTALVPGDRVAVGETLFGFDVPSPVAAADVASILRRSWAVEEVLPAVGEAAALLGAASALLSASSEAVALRRLVDQAWRLVEADRTGVLVTGREGLVAAAVAGTTSIDVPRQLLSAVLDRREVVQAGCQMVAPLWAGAAAFGVLVAARDGDPLEEREARLLGILGRLGGDAIASLRSRTSEQDWHLTGASRAFRKTLDEARRLALSESPALLLGEAGVGKVRMARWLHARSRRAGAPLVLVDCSWPVEVLERALGGWAPGSSIAEQVEGGTLELARIDLLPRAFAPRVVQLQPTLARRDCRLVVTAPCPPGQLAARGELDGTLALALQGEELLIPPLRERRGDLEVLFHHFAIEAARRLSNARALVLSPEALQALERYRWPGNLVELRACAERLACVCEGEVSVRHLPPELSSEVLPGSDATLAEAVRSLERDRVARALKEAGGKKAVAARLLGISRPTLDKKIAAYRLPVR